MKKLLASGTLAIAMLLCSAVAGSAPAWYYGKVERVFLYSSGFVVTFDTTALDDCLHQYVYFQTPHMTEKGIDRALSVALAAQASGKVAGVVIDKSINGPGGVCFSDGSIEIKN